MVVPALVTFGPKNDLEFHGVLLEWLLYLPGLGELLPRPVSGRSPVHALRDLCRVTFVAGTNPYEVRLAWQMGLDVTGPLIFRAFYTMRGMARCHPNVPSNYDIAAGRVLWTNGVEDVHHGCSTRPTRLWISRSPWSKGCADE